MYVVLLQKSALSLAVPVTNSLAAVITAIVGWSLGEQSLSYRKLLSILSILLRATSIFFLGSYFGIFLILAGTTFCILDKMYPINIFKLLAYKVLYSFTFWARRLYGDIVVRNVSVLIDFKFILKKLQKRQR